MDKNTWGIELLRVAQVVGRYLLILRLGDRTRNFLLDNRTYLLLDLVAQDRRGVVTEVP